MFSLKKILVVGSANVDFVIGVRQAPELGETILCRSFRKTCGGKAVFDALGAKTYVINAEPDGTNINNNAGSTHIEGLQKLAVEKGLDVGFAYDGDADRCLCVDEKGNNSIIVIPGANNLCDVDYLRRNRARFEESDIVLLQMEIPFESVCYAVELASGLHKTVILNPAPAPDSLPDEVYAGLDYLTPNESEFKRLTGCPTDEVEELAVHCKPLLEKGTRNIIITLGSRGALHVNREGHTLYRPPEVQAVDTTAAGDTFNAALARELADGRSTEEAIVFANMASALAVSRVGAQDSIPSYEEVLDFKKRME